MDFGALKQARHQPSVAKYFTTQNLQVLGASALIGTFVFFCIGWYIDTLLFDQSIIEKVPPNFGLGYVAKTAVICIGSFLLVFAIVTLGSISQKGEYGLDWDTRGLSTLFSADLKNLPPPHLTNKELLIYGVMLISYSFVALFFYSPWAFHALVREDNLLEWCSVSFYVLSSGIFLYLFMLYSRSQIERKFIYCFSALSFSLIFFLITMEETSWLQRVLEYETPKVFSSNQQSEFNFHNFQTKPIEHLYYLGSFFFLIVLPFIKEQIQFSKYTRELFFFIPTRFILFISAIFVAYNWQMWNVIFTQISFFITFFILLYYVVATRQNTQRFTLSLCLFSTLVITEILFIVYGDRLFRTYDLTEYKEFFIPLGFLLYSLEMLFKSRNLFDIDPHFE